ncbi:hypothetical protein [Bdellovibrio sp. HCB2-146]|uniref:hypothetical protein n=1 Tax=Bdellovibrio sp. HCB2-146 TaxID=3394362 RepID=UPI0039BD438E
MKSLVLSKIYFWTVVAIFVGGLLWSGYKLEILFPFYPWTMYASAISGDDFRTFKTYCVGKDGKEFAVTELDLWYQESNYYGGIDSLMSASLPLTEEKIELCRNGMKSFARDLQGYCAEISVYRLYWKKFVGPRVNNPDEKSLLCELEVPNASSL